MIQSDKNDAFEEWFLRADFDQRTKLVCQAAWNAASINALGDSMEASAPSQRCGVPLGEGRLCCLGKRHNGDHLPETARSHVAPKIPMGDPLTMPGDSRREDRGWPPSNARPKGYRFERDDSDRLPKERIVFDASPSTTPHNGETPRTDAKAFRITWTGVYRVSIPNYEGGEVVPADDAREIERELAEARTTIAGLEGDVSLLREGIALKASASSATRQNERIAVPVREVMWALEREAANTDDSPQWRAATALRQMTQWETRTIVCSVGDQTLEIVSPTDGTTKA